MALFSTSRRYGSAAQTLHWLSVVLVAVAYLVSEEGEEGEPGADGGLLSVHETMGMLVLLLTLLRVVWRIADLTPEPLGGPKLLQKAASAVQGLLYLLLVAVPVLGTLTAWSDGNAVVLFGGAIEIGPWLAASETRGEVLGGLHKLGGNLMVFLALIHALAALMHHFVLRDDTLRRMLPGRR